MRYLWLGAGGLSLKRARDAPQGGESEVLVRSDWPEFAGLTWSW